MREKVFVLKSLILMSLLTLFNSCDLDQVESRYSDFETADKNGLSGQGWIPSELVFKSMTDIYLRTNLDLNTCVFNYNLSKSDFEVTKRKIKPISINFKKIHRLKTSSKWDKSVNDLKHYFIIDSNSSDTVYLAIDEREYRIYGWRK